MSEERMKVLNMLSEGKITAEEAARLLEALGDTKAEEPTTSKRSERFKVKFGSDDLDDIEDQIKEQVDRAKRTIKASMPRVKKTIQKSMPDVERVIQEATSALPRVGEILDEVTQTLSETFSERSRGGHRDYPAKAERKFEEQADLAAGSRLVLHNPKGAVAVEAWDQEGVEIEALAVVRAYSEEAAEEFVRQIALKIERHPEALEIRPQIPPRDDESEVGSCKIDFVLRVPAKISLDLQTAHGNMEVGAVEGDVVLGTRHGATRLEGAGGNASIQQAHGPLAIWSVGGDLIVECRHGKKCEIGTVEGAGTLTVNHGPLVVEKIGQQAAVAVRHGSLRLNQVGGDASVSVNHGPLDIKSISGNATLQTNHAALKLHEVGGDAQITSSHGPVRLSAVSGTLTVQASHGPVEVDQVDRGAVVKGSRGGVRLAKVDGDVTVENDRGGIELGSVSGRIAVRNDRADIHIKGAGAEVMAENQRGNIVVSSEVGVSSAHTLRTRRGNVDLVLPEGSAVEVQARVHRGRVITDLPLDVAANSRAGQTVSGRLGQTVSGTLGEGGALVQVEVEDGNLSLRDS